MLNKINSTVKLNKIKALILIFIFLYIPFSSKSQLIKLNPEKDISEYKISFFSNNEGLPIKGALSINQTSDGYFWIGTYNGLVRFDGVQMYVYSNSNVENIHNNSFLSIYEDKDSSKWFGTLNGLLHFYNNTWDLFTIENGLPSELIECIYRDSKGLLWIGTAKGICYFENGKFSNEKIPDELKNVTIKDFFEDHTGKLWIATEQAGLYYRFNNSYVNYCTEKKINIHDIRTVCEDSRGNIWFGSNNGLFKIKDNQEIETFNSENGLVSNDIKIVFEDSQNMIWIGTGVGLNKIYKGKISSFINTEKFKKHTITGIEEDFEGNIWVSTYDYGIYNLKGSKFNLYSCSEKLETDVINSIFVDYNNVFLIGTKNGVFKFVNTEFSEFKTKKPLPDQTVRDVYRDSNRNLWICTINGLVEETKDGSILYNEKNGLSNNYVRFAYEDNNNKMWFGTENGLNYLDNNTFKIYSRKDGLSNDYILSVFMDSEKNIWIGTRDGLNLLKDNKIQTFYTKDGLAGNTIFKIYEDKEKDLWIGCNGGLTRYKNKEFQTITTKRGLLAINAFQIIEDHNEFFWISSVEGIFSIPKSELNKIADLHEKIDYIKLYNNDDELDGNQCTANARNSIDKNGNIWFATYNGLLMINPDSIPFNSVPPINKIEYLKVDNSIVPLSENIILKAGTQRVEIKFTGLSFTSPKNVKLKYMLEGFDSTWINAGGRREAFYTNLKPGKYEFKVISSNNDGIWNHNEAKLKFQQIAFFYQTIWFYIILIIILIGLIWLIFYIRSSEVLRRNNELEKMVNLRTAEIEQKNKEITFQSNQLQFINQELEKLSIVACETDNSIVICDEDGNIEWVNDGFTKLFGYELDEFIKEKGNNLIKASFNENINQLFADCICLKESITYTTFNSTKKGKKIWVQTTLTPILDEARYITRLVAIDTDITKLKLAEEEITHQKEEIQAQSEKLEKTNYDLESKNVQIIDSINYAKLIQEALLPSNTQIKARFNDFFILFRPRDIVSGDFYWFSEKTDIIYFAVADCTGHGVPGAFMTMIGNTMLNEIVSHNQKLLPSEILIELNEKIKFSLNQADNSVTKGDGMDISLCCFNLIENNVQISCANHSVLIITKNNELKELSYSGLTIGRFFKSKTEKIFTDFTFALNEIKNIYLFSDGYSDQFGGCDFKKFGSERLKNLLVKNNNLSMDEQLISLKNEHDNWKGDRKQIDDITVVGLKL
ncbi:MAG: hypothetical protein A2046_08320 [Bacteroidetes bacterium GWA2_30_7]|nr:MAG: hypothetical protein A2046_08320 [Bacteroidetes bacterium GWA2_30_7]